MGRAHLNKCAKYCPQKLCDDILPALAPGHVPRQAVGKRDSRIQVACNTARVAANAVNAGHRGNCQVAARLLSALAVFWR